MRHRCAVCWRPLSSHEPQFLCHFCDTGFTADNGIPLRACRTRYHPNCIRIGLPFQTRLPKDRGLFCTPNLASFKHFVCEACTVRAALSRELGKRVTDWRSSCLIALVSWTSPTTGQKVPSKPTSRSIGSCRKGAFLSLSLQLAQEECHIR
jgi:hypothetical protein